MRRLVTFAAVLLFLPPAASVASESRIPYQESVWYDCGPEEPVSLSGTLLRRVWENTDGAGVRHRHIVYTLQGVSGYGAWTGDRYVAGQNETASQKYTYVLDEEIVETHSILTIRLTRTGAGDDAFLYFAVDAVYSTAQEDPIEEKVRFWTECRG